jgi:hypothetical protein
MPFLIANPNLSGGQRTFSHYFNTAAFVAPPQDVKGNAGVGIVRGPGQENVDLSISKTFNIWERFHADFRGDLLNGFNHPQWASINTTFDNNPAGTFGYLTSARQARVIQLGLRLAF